MNYKPDYLKGGNPLQNYYTNKPTESKAAQIKKYIPSYAESRAQRTSMS